MPGWMKPGWKQVLTTVHTVVSVVRLMLELLFPCWRLVALQKPM